MENNPIGFFHNSFCKNYILDDRVSNKNGAKGIRAFTGMIGKLVGLWGKLTGKAAEVTLNEKKYTINIKSLEKFISNNQNPDYNKYISQIIPQISSKKGISSQIQKCNKSLEKIDNNDKKQPIIDCLKQAQIKASQADSLAPEEQEILYKNLLFLNSSITQYTSHTSQYTSAGPFQVFNLTSKITDLLNASKMSKKNLGCDSEQISNLKKGLNQVANNIKELLSSDESLTKQDIKSSINTYYEALRQFFRGYIFINDFLNSDLHKFMPLELSDLRQILLSFSINNLLASNQKLPELNENLRNFTGAVSNILKQKEDQIQKFKASVEVLEDMDQLLEPSSVLLDKIKFQPCTNFAEKFLNMSLKHRSQISITKETIMHDLQIARNIQYMAKLLGQQDSFEERSLSQILPLDKEELLKDTFQNIYKKYEFLPDMYRDTKLSSGLDSLSQQALSFLSGDDFDESQEVLTFDLETTMNDLSLAFEKLQDIKDNARKYKIDTLDKIHNYLQVFEQKMSFPEKIRSFVENIGSIEVA